MNRIGLITIVLTGLCLIAPVQTHAQDADIRLIIRGDDMGFSHAANEACIRCYREGVMKTVEVMVPTPWYPEAVKLLKANPGLDVGVHLTLNAEWETCRWGPVTHAPSLVDPYGHFRIILANTGGNPPWRLDAKIEEVERELSRQIELAVADIPQLSHITTHMHTPTATPELRAMVDRLSEKHRLPVKLPGVRAAGGMGPIEATPEQREAEMVRLAENLKPGTWLLVEHPGLDTPELRGISDEIATSRAGVTRAWTSPKVREVITRRKVQLISYADFHGRKPATAESRP